MSVTLLKQNGILKLLDSSEDIPEGAVIRLFTSDELERLHAEDRAWLDAQMPSFIRGDEEETAEDLFDIPIGQA